MATKKTSTEIARKKASAPERLAGLKGKETTTMAAAAAVSEDKPLTDKQRAFAMARASGESVPNAMAQAGYNEQPSYGYRMAKMPNILAEYDRIKAKWEEAAQMTRKKVMDMHMEAFEMAKMMAEPATMVSAAREIGRMCGYYEPVKQKVELTVNGQVAVKRMEAMSDEDLLKLVMEGVRQAQNPDAPVLEHDAEHDLDQDD